MAIHFSVLPIVIAECYESILRVVPNNIGAYHDEFI